MSVVKSKRLFSLLLDGKQHGKYKGRLPCVAGKNLFKNLSRMLDVNECIFEIIDLENNKIYSYVGERKALDIPQMIKIKNKTFLRTHKYRVRKNIPF